MNHEMRKRPEQLSLLAAILSLGLLAGTGVVSLRWSHSSIIFSAIFSFLIAFTYALFAWWYYVLVRANAREIQERETLAQKFEGDSLFDNDDSLLIAARSLRHFKRYIQPIFALGIGLLLVLIGGYRYLDRSFHLETISLSEKSLSLAGFAAFIMILTLLIGSYFNGVSREQGCRWLRPLGALYFLGTLLHLIAIMVLLLDHFKFGNWDRPLGNIVILIYPLLGLELMVNVVLEFYRPKANEMETVPLYESRFLSFFTQPGGVVLNIARTINYQLGFNISDVWLSKMFSRVVIPNVIIALFILYALDCVITIDSHEMGIVETASFKKGYRRKIISPGIHFKLPRPFASYRKYPVKTIQTMNIGYTHHHDSEQPMVTQATRDMNHIQAKIICWDHQHFNQEQYFLTASKEQDQNYRFKSEPQKQHSSSATVPVNFISVNMPVQYTIDENRLFDYCYNYNNPEEVLQGICHRELVGYLASNDLFDVLGSGLLTSQKQIADRIKNTLNQIKPPLGLEIRYISLTNIHPPTQVASEFQKVVAAQEENVGKILRAEGYLHKMVHEAASRRASIELESQAYKVERTEAAVAQVRHFTSQQIAFRKAPQIFRTRRLMAVLQDTKNIRRFFMHGDSKKMIQVNLEEPLTPDLLNDFKFGNDMK